MPKSKQPTAAPKPIAVYIRVSSRDQKTDSQRQSILEWLAKSGYDLDQVGWYVEVESGRTMRSSPRSSGSRAGRARGLKTSPSAPRLGGP
jgi:DNA invertase Pin-like site-specific DNA recombinase